jgi:hypothetical protein
MSTFQLFPKLFFPVKTMCAWKNLLRALVGTFLKKLIFFVVWDCVFLCNPGWRRSHDLTVTASAWRNWTFKRSKYYLHFKQRSLLLGKRAADGRDVKHGDWSMKVVFLCPGNCRYLSNNAFGHAAIPDFTHAHGWPWGKIPKYSL